MSGSVVKTAKDAGFTFTSRILGRAFLLLLQVLISRLYGVEAFGLFAIGWVIIRILWTFSMFGLQNGLIKFGTDYLGKGDIKGFVEVVHTAILTNILIGIVLGSGLFLLAPYLSEVIYKDSKLLIFFQFFAILVPLLPLITVLASLSRVSMDMKASAIAEDVIGPVVIVITLVLLYFNGVGYEAIIIANILGYTLAVIFIMYFVLRQFPMLKTKISINFSNSRKLFTYSVQTFSANLSAVLTNSFSRLILGGYVSVEKVGYFQAASQLVIITDVIGNALRVISTPNFAALYASKNLKKTEELYKTIARWMLFLSAPIFCIYIVDGGNLMSFLFGEDFREYYHILIIFSIGQLINLATGPTVQILIIFNQHTKWMIMSTGMLFLNILVSFLLISQFGVIGGAIAVSIVNIALSGMSMYLLSLVFNIKNILIATVKNLSFILIPIGIVAISKYIIPNTGNLGGIIINVLLYGVSFILMLYIVGISSEDKELLTSLRKKIIK